MNILQVNTADRGGGAEGSAWNLFRAYRERGHESWMAVGRKDSDDPHIVEIPRKHTAGPGAVLRWFADRLRAMERLPKAEAIARRLDILADPARRHDWIRGIEDFNFPGTANLLELPPEPPDILHCHNLHGGYFDLRALPDLSQRLPVILNLRDTWLLTGHCGYFIECDHWRQGCGNCPDLQRYPPVRRDATALNWQRKADIYRRAKLYVTAPSRWLLDRARESMLNAREYRLIPNGIDTAVFRPGDRRQARQRLGLPPDRPIVLFAAASRRNVYKDPETMVGAVQAVGARESGRPLLFVSLGRRPPRHLHDVPIRAIPFQRDPAAVADYYRAADVFVHTARAEAFGKTATEAMACGTPVVASRVGGLPEQVIHGKTGLLVPVNDPQALADAVMLLLEDAQRRNAMAAAAAQQGARFSLTRQTDAFLTWYEDVLTDWHARN